MFLIKVAKNGASPLLVAAQLGSLVVGHQQRQRSLNDSPLECIKTQCTARIAETEGNGTVMKAAGTVLYCTGRMCKD